MSTQFLVRSQNNEHTLTLRTLLYDGLELHRIQDDGMAVFEIADADVLIELVVRRKKSAVVSGVSSAQHDGAKKRTAEAVEVSSKEAKRCKSYNINHGWVNALKKSKSVFNEDRVAAVANLAAVKEQKTKHAPELKDSAVKRRENEKVSVLHTAIRLLLLLA